MARRTILAAGGIVFRGNSRPLVAVVQLRKYKHWVLPKGKLKPNERPLAAAKREVLEETGHKVSVGGFLGTISYEAGGKAKVVQFWRMQTIGDAVREPAADVREVRWLPIKKAIEKLSHPREQVFLRSVGALPCRASRGSRGLWKVGTWLGARARDASPRR